MKCSGTRSCLNVDISLVDKILTHNWPRSFSLKHRDWLRIVDNNGGAMHTLLYGDMCKVEGKQWS